MAWTVEAWDLSKAFTIKRNAAHDLKVKLLGLFNARHRERRERFCALRGASFVSRDLGTIEQMCDRGCLLIRGRLEAEGGSREDHPALSRGSERARPSGITPGQYGMPTALSVRRDAATYFDWSHDLLLLEALPPAGEPSIHPKAWPPAHIGLDL